MLRRTLAGLIILALAACGGESATTGPAPAEQTTTAAAMQAQQTTTAVDACVDSAQTYSADMKPIVQEWDDAIKLAGQTGRGQLANQVASLQTIKRKADAVTVPDCAAIAHEYLVSSMNASIDGFLAFLGQKDEALVTVFFTAATTTMRSYNEELALATSDDRPQPTVVVTISDIPDDQLPGVLWIDGDLGPMTDEPQKPIAKPFAGGLASAAYILSRSGKPLGKITITSFDTAQQALDAVVIEKTAYSSNLATATFPRVKDLGDLAYGTIGQEQELFLLARCRVAVRIELPREYGTEIAKFARKIDDRAKAICAGS